MTIEIFQKFHEIYANFERANAAMAFYVEHSSTHIIYPPPDRCTWKLYRLRYRNYNSEVYLNKKLC